MGFRYRWRSTFPARSHRDPQPTLSSLHCVRLFSCPEGSFTRPSRPGAGLPTPARATRRRRPPCGPSASARGSRAVSPRRPARRGPARSGEMASPPSGRDCRPAPVRQRFAQGPWEQVYPDWLRRAPNRAVRPRRFGAMAPHARGVGLTAAPLLSESFGRPWGRSRPASGSLPLAYGWGVPIAGAAGGRSVRSPREPDARAAVGRRKAAPGHRGTGKTKAVTQ